MGLIPLPSHVHYELLLQLLERQTLRLWNPRPMSMFKPSR